MTGCDQCAVLSINGVPCHETGCPDAWIDPATGKGYPVECWECGCGYVPAEKPPHRTARICGDCQRTDERCGCCGDPADMDHAPADGLCYECRIQLC